MTAPLQDQLSLLDLPSALEEPSSPVISINKATVAEYFAGIGLVRLGLEQAGWETVYANDFSADKFEMYSAFFEDAEKYYEVGDIFDIDPSAVPETVLATASFPCIDLSLAGNQNGLEGKHSSAFWGFIRVLEEQREKKPSFVLLENVPGWITSNEGQDFKLTIQALNMLGYACDVFSINAMYFTPQSRLRIFVVGILTDEPNRATHKLLQRSSTLATTALKKAIKSHDDLDWHMLSVPDLLNSKYDRLDEIIEKLPSDDKRWWSEDEVLRHLEMMAPDHRKRVRALQDLPGISYRTFYRRKRKGIQRAEVRSDNTAGCLRTAGGGSSRQMLVEITDGVIKMRHMTPREYARLQGVPDDYPIPDKTNQALTGFGDAVCVPVITWLANNALNPLVSGV